MLAAGSGLDWDGSRGIAAEVYMESLPQRARPERAQRVNRRSLERPTSTLAAVVQSHEGRLSSGVEPPRRRACPRDCDRSRLVTRKYQRGTKARIAVRAALSPAPKRWCAAEHRASASRREAPNVVDRRVVRDDTYSSLSLRISLGPRSASPSSNVRCGRPRGILDLLQRDASALR